MTTQQDIDSFAAFAAHQIQNGASDLSVEEIFDLWQAQQQSTEHLSESIAAVKSALDDMEAGDTGRPFEEFAEEMRNTYQIPDLTIF